MDPAQDTAVGEWASGRSQIKAGTSGASAREVFEQSLHPSPLDHPFFASPSPPGLGLALPSGGTVNGERSDLGSGHAGECLVFI